MPISSVYVIPHGSMILDPFKVDEAYQSDVKPLNQALLNISKQMTDDQPDVILLITPHGFSLSGAHGIYLNNQAYGKGDLEDGQKWDEFQVSANIEIDLSKDLLSFMKQKLPSRFDGITQYSTELTPQLGWAEVVPLCNYFNPTSLTKTKLIILSLTSARKDQIESLTQESFVIGGLLWEYFKKVDKKVSLVVSSDLAHTHLITKGPLIGQEPYGTTEEAEKFDQNCEIWARNPTNIFSLDKLLNENRIIASKALSCGYLGIIMSAGILEKCEQDGKIIKTTFMCRGTPTYFGMIFSYYFIL